MNHHRPRKHHLWARELSAASRGRGSMVNLHGPKLVEGDSWLRYCEGVYEERGVVEDEDLCTSGGCL